MAYNPYPPGGSSWFTPGGSTGDPSAYTSLNPATAYQMANRPASPGASSGTPTADVDAWNKKIADIAAALQASSGWEREKLRLQYEDAQKARDNAVQLEQMRNQETRYGTDTQFQTALLDRQEKARQYDADHGLAVADAYAKYASSPDQMFMMGDFQDALARAGQGSGPAPYGSTGSPSPKTWQDFSALAGLGSAMPAPPASSGGGSSTPTPNGGGGSGSGTDPRLTAANAVMKAIPPSDGTGHSGDNYAALSAIESLYRAAKPGTVERLLPGQQAAFGAGLSRLGYYAPDALADLKRTAPGQQSVRMA